VTDIVPTILDCPVGVSMRYAFDERFRSRAFDPERAWRVAPSQGKHVIGVEFAKKRMGEYHASYGQLKLYVDNKVVGEREIWTMAGHFSLCGEGLRRL